MWLVQHPIFSLVFAVILAAVIIKQCFLRRKLLKNRLVISFVLIFILAMFSVFYEEIKVVDWAFTTLNYSLLGIDILMAIFFFFNIDISFAKENFQTEVIRSLDNENYFLFLNKKGKIIEISTLLLEMFALEKEECLGKKVNVVFNDKLDIERINGRKASNLEFFKYLLAPATDKEKQSLTIDFYFNDQTKGCINLVETPIFVLERYAGRVYFGSSNVLNQEVVPAKQTNEGDEMLNKRFEAILEKAQEGIYFADLTNNSIWCNDYLVANLTLLGNSFNLSDFYLNFEIDDYENYKRALALATPENPNFSVSYRYKNGYDTIFVKENATVIFNGKKPIEICSTLITSLNRNYMRINNQLVDNLKEEAELLGHILALAKAEKTFEVVYFRLANIPEINEKYNRSLGSMVIEEYVAVLQKSFADNDAIFRISGLDFAMVLTDIRKMENLRKVLLTKNILNTKLTYGATTVMVDVYMGISFSNEAIQPKDVYYNAKNALLAGVKQKKNLMFYRDINY